MLGINTNISTPSEDFRGWVQGPDTRGSLDIIWSCVAVLVTALWTVLHINIPGRGDGQRRLFARKFRWGCASILAPDFLTLVAASQWDAAKKSVATMRELKEVEKDNTRWCMEHAFYANSGGFLLKCPDIDSFPIDADTLHYLVQREYIKLPTITRDEVWDKSKADLFAKAATVVQSGWLIINSIGRKASGLPISPMETFTLAFIVSTVMSYFFWWRKPQNVETPTILICERTIAQIRADAGFQEHTWEESPTEFINRENRRWRRRDMFEVKVHSTDIEDHLGSIPETSPHTTQPDLVEPKDTSKSILSDKSPPTRVDSENTLFSATPIRPLPPRIYNDAILPAGLSPLVLLSVFIPSVAHSAIHLLGWNFDYPTYEEKQLWRSAAVILNAMGAISSVGVRVLTQAGYKGRFNLIFIWVNNDPKQRTNDKDAPDGTNKQSIYRLRKNFAFWDAFLTLTTLCLLLARFAIIVEVIISFRFLPKNVFVTVNWSDFIPHV